MGLRRGAAARVVQGRSSVRLCRGVAAWAQQPGAALGRSSVGLRWSAAWGCVGAQGRGAALECSVGLRRGAAAWGCAGVQRGAV